MASGGTVGGCTALGAGASASKGGVCAWPLAVTGAGASVEGGSAVLAGFKWGGCVQGSIASGPVARPLLVTVMSTGLLTERCGRAELGRCLVGVLLTKRRLDLRGHDSSTLEERCRRWCRS